MNTKNELVNKERILMIEKLLRFEAQAIPRVVAYLAYVRVLGLCGNKEDK